jgi:hypothetical protein
LTIKYPWDGLEGKEFSWGELGKPVTFELQAYELKAIKAYLKEHNSNIPALSI